MVSSNRDFVSPSVNHCHTVVQMKDFQSKCLLTGIRYLFPKYSEAFVAQGSRGSVLEDWACSNPANSLKFCVPLLVFSFGTFTEKPFRSIWVHESGHETNLIQYQHSSLRMWIRTKDSEWLKLIYQATLSFFFRKWWASHLLAVRG